MSNRRKFNCMIKLTAPFIRHNRFSLGAFGRGGLRDPSDQDSARLQGSPSTLRRKVPRKCIGIYAGAAEKNLYVITLKSFNRIFDYSLADAFFVVA